MEEKKPINPILVIFAIIGVISTLAILLFVGYMLGTGGAFSTPAVVESIPAPTATTVPTSAPTVTPTVMPTAEPTNTPIPTEESTDTNQHGATGGGQASVNHTGNITDETIDDDTLGGIDQSDKVDNNESSNKPTTQTPAEGTSIFKLNYNDVDYEYTIINLNKTMYATENIPTRSVADESDTFATYTIRKGEKVEIIGQTEDGKWYMIVRTDYGFTDKQFILAEYLTDKAPTVATPTPNPTEKPTENPTENPTTSETQKPSGGIDQSDKVVTPTPTPAQKPTQSTKYEKVYESGTVTLYDIITQSYVDVNYAFGYYIDGYFVYDLPDLENVQYVIPVESFKEEKAWNKIYGDYHQGYLDDSPCYGKINDGGQVNPDHILDPDGWNY